MNALIFIKENFLNGSTIKIPNQIVTKKYCKLTTRFWRDVCYVFQNWGSKRESTNCFDVRKLIPKLWKQSLKRNELKRMLLEYIKKGHKRSQEKLIKKRLNEKSYPVHNEDSNQSDATLFLMFGFFQSSSPAWSDVITLWQLLITKLSIFQDLF